MSKNVVTFGRDPEFYKRRAAGMKDENPRDAMRFLYKALEIRPDDAQARVMAARIALEAGRPRLAVRLASQAVSAAEGCYVLGKALQKMGLYNCALTALSFCAQKAEREDLKWDVLFDVGRIQARSDENDRWERRQERARERALELIRDGRYRLAQNWCRRMDERYPDGPFMEIWSWALWKQGKRSEAQWVAGAVRSLLPVAGRSARHSQSSLGEAGSDRRRMLLGDWDGVLDGPPKVGAEREYMRAAASARRGDDREEYMARLLDMSAMDPEDPAAAWALRLASEGRDGEIPRLYGVCRQAEAAMRAELWGGNPSRTAIRWGLMRGDTAVMAAWGASRVDGGEWLLREALADPYLSEGCRRIVSAALSRIPDGQPFVGITRRLMWVGDCWEPEKARVPRGVFAILKAALEVCPQEMAASVFQAWAALAESRSARHCTRDISGWAAAVALAARALDGNTKTVEVLSTRRAEEKSRWLAKRASKEKKA